MADEISQGTSTAEEIKKAVEDALNGLPGFSALLDAAQNLRQLTKEKDHPTTHEKDKAGSKYSAVLRQASARVSQKMALSTRHKMAAVEVQGHDWWAYQGVTKVWRAERAASDCHAWWGAADHAGG